MRRGDSVDEGTVVQDGADQGLVQIKEGFYTIEAVVGMSIVIHQVDEEILLWLP